MNMMAGGGERVKAPVRKKVLDRIAKGKTYIYQIHGDLGLSTGSVSQAVEALERMDCVRKGPKQGGRRILEITPKGRKLHEDWGQYKDMNEKFIEIEIRGVTRRYSLKDGSLKETKVVLRL